MDFERGIWQAAMDGNLAKVKILVKKNKNNVSATDQSGYTPLHYACRHQKLEIVKFLIQNGSPTDPVTPSTLSTPLHRAVLGTNEDISIQILQFLVKNGGDVKRKDCDGATALDKAKHFEKKKVEEYLLSFK
uniref:Uncharacterized protein n=1 Tax=Paramoeba aestuarina TaxID=180227 RepID=A0A7S4KD01_9EUKA